MSVLPSSFFDRDAVTVARCLLGKHLVRRYRRRSLVGIVSETEAYLGADDSASHAFRGLTPRNRVMFGPPGRAYVYMIYGVHHMLNAVTGRQGTPAAVLIRAVRPLKGQTTMAALRGRSGTDITDGPGKLCRAMSIDRTLNGWDLTAGNRLWFENGTDIPDRSTLAGPRIGIAYADAIDRRRPWRFIVAPSHWNRQA